MPYNFSTKPGRPAEFKLLVKANADSYDLTAEFTRSKIPQLQWHTSTEPVILSVPVESNGNELTINLTAEQVDFVGRSYYRIKAVKDGNALYIENGKLEVYHGTPSVEVRGPNLFVRDPGGGEVLAGSVIGPQGIQGVKGDKGDQGIQGIQGLQGIQGVQGPVGPAGLEWRGTWLPDRDYVADDAVFYDSASWFASADPAVGVAPSLDPQNPWQPLALRGAQGIQGQQGIQGIQGNIGPKGDPGDLTPAQNAQPLAAGTYAPLLSWLPSTRRWVLGGNVTVGDFPGGTFPADKSGTITIVAKQPATGGPYTVTWPATLEWANDAPAPLMPTAPNSELIVHLFWTGQAWRAMVGGVFLP